MRTRSGLLDRFDLTENADLSGDVYSTSTSTSASNGDGDVTAIHHETEENKTRFREGFRFASSSPIRNTDGISILRTIPPSVSPQTTTESENDNDNDTDTIVNNMYDTINDIRTLQKPGDYDIYDGTEQNLKRVQRGEATSNEPKVAAHGDGVEVVEELTIGGNEATRRARVGDVEIIGPHRLRQTLESAASVTNHRSLRPRTGIQLPHRLRLSADMLLGEVYIKQTQPKEISPVSSPSKPQIDRQRISPAFTPNKQQIEQKRFSPISSSPLPNFQHDLFLPGKAKQPNSPLAVTKVTSKSTPKKRTKHKYCKTPTKSNKSKRKRCPDYPLRDRSIHFSGGIPRLPTSKIGTSKWRWHSPLQSTVNRIAHPKTAISPLRPSPHFTRSRGNTIATKTTPEIYGYLGAYWRGEPTKYAGVPYQKRTINAKSSRITATPTPKATAISPLRSSSHFTRSHGNTVAAKTTPEIYGYLGAYWRGEPTKYAGVPYQKGTINAKSPRITATVTPKADFNQLPVSTSVAAKTKLPSPIDREEPKSTSTNHSRLQIKRLQIKRRMSSLAISRNRQAKPVKGDFKSVKRVRIQRKGMLLPIDRNQVGVTAVEESRLSMTMAMPETANNREKDEGQSTITTTNTAVKPIFTATLEGTISYEPKSRKYFILGTWHCPLSKSFPPQKFSLVRSLREGEEGPSANRSSLDGSFDGYCVVSTKSLGVIGEPTYHDRLVFECDVLLEFKSSTSSINTARKPLEIHGSGSNKFGAFIIDGKAQPYPNEDGMNCNNNLYSVVLQKQYLPKVPNNIHPNDSSRSTRCNSIH